MTKIVKFLNLNVQNELSKSQNLAVRIIGLKFIWLSSSCVFFPFVYYNMLDDLGIGFAFWPLIFSLFFSGVLLLIGKMTTVTSFILLGFLVLLSLAEPGMFDFDYWYIGWILTAILLSRFGVPKVQLIELGWKLIAVTFFVHGLAKLILAGRPWLSGHVTYGFFLWAMPNTSKFLIQLGIYDQLMVVAGWVIILWHLLALPHGFTRRGREAYLVSALIFHVIILFTPLYFISIGFFAFWAFLIDGLRSDAGAV